MVWVRRQGLVRSWRVGGRAGLESEPPPGAGEPHFHPPLLGPTKINFNLNSFINLISAQFYINLNSILKIIKSL